MGLIIRTAKPKENFEEKVIFIDRNAIDEVIEMIYSLAIYGISQSPAFIKVFQSQISEMLKNVLYDFKIRIKKEKILILPDFKIILK